MVARGRGVGREWDGVAVWVRRCKLFHLERISHEVLLCSTENYVQSLAID